MLLKEYGRAVLELDPVDSAFLADLALRQTVAASAVITAVIPAGAGHYMVVAGGYLGRLGLPSGRIDITTRFPGLEPIEVLMAGTQVAAAVPKQPVAVAPAHLLVDAIADAVLDQVQTLVRRGLAKSYLRTLRTTPPYPGRLRPDLHLRLFSGRPDRLVTEQRPLSVDTFENRVLRRALAILSPLPLGEHNDARVRMLKPHFQRVALQNLTASDMRRARLTPVTRHYQRAIELSAVLAVGQSLGPDAGYLHGSSLLFFMPSAWEAFVVERVHAALPDCQVLPSFGMSISDEGHTAVADALIKKGGKALAVIDAKYKDMVNAPSSDDIYQMVSYCHNLSISCAVLVYPQAGADSVLHVGSFRLHVLGLSTTEAGHLPFDERLSNALSGGATWH